PVLSAQNGSSYPRFRDLVWHVGVAEIIVKHRVPFCSVRGRSATTPPIAELVFSIALVVLLVVSLFHKDILLVRTPLGQPANPPFFVLITPLVVAPAPYFQATVVRTAG